MQTSKIQSRILTIIGHLGMLSILAMAYWLWEERSIVFDNSLYSYKMIWRESFYIPHDRKINYLWQWIPVLALKFGVSLPTFLKFVSVAPILFLYSVFAFISHVLKNKLASVYFVLSLVILARYKFYSAISEVYLSMAFAALMLAWLTVDRSRLLEVGKRTYLIIGLILISLAYLGHPLIFYPLGVVILFDYGMQKNWKSLNHFLWLGYTSLLFLIRYMSTSSGSYEGKVVESFHKTGFGLDFISKTADLYTMDIFWRYVETQWSFPLVVCTLMLLYLIYKKKYLGVASLVLASTVWILFVCNLCSYLERPYLFMIEGYLGLWSLILLAPMLYIEVNKKELAYLRSALIISLLIFGLHRISSVRSFYTERSENLEAQISMAKNANSRNLILETNLEVWDKYWLIWSIPFESLLLSSLKPDNKSAIIIYDKYPKESLLKEPFEVMIGTVKDSIKDMNPAYFTIDSGPFRRGI